MIGLKSPLSEYKASEFSERIKEAPALCTGAVLRLLSLNQLAFINASATCLVVDDLQTVTQQNLETIASACASAIQSM
ncbi:hypothetical protein EMIT0P253_110054 [Pseudomonas sp. IT-P253]